MNENPIEWLVRLHQAGVDFREEGWGLRTQDQDKTDAWEKRAEEWAHEFRDGIAIWTPWDIGRVETINRPPVEDLPLDNPWHDPSIPTWPHMTGTGEGRPGNNPYSRHSGLVDRAEEILNEWRLSPPKERQKTGRKRVEHPNGLEAARKAKREGRAKSNREAARIAVEEVGRGPYASEETAIDQIRKHI